MRVILFRHKHTCAPSIFQIDPMQIQYRIFSAFSIEKTTEM